MEICFQIINTPAAPLHFPFFIGPEIVSEVFFLITLSYTITLERKKDIHRDRYSHR